MRRHRKVHGLTTRISYEQYLLQLTERECESRRRNLIAALLRESGCHGRRRWQTSN
jgi:hypothetical protein